MTSGIAETLSVIELNNKSTIIQIVYDLDEADALSNQIEVSCLKINCSETLFAFKRKNIGKVFCNYQ